MEPRAMEPRAMEPRRTRIQSRERSQIKPNDAYFDFLPWCRAVVPCRGAVPYANLIWRLSWACCRTKSWRSCRLSGYVRTGGNTDRGAGPCQAGGADLPAWEATLSAGTARRSGVL